jgi:hypothetical protein
MSITNKKHKPKAVFLHKPFDLNSSGKIDPAEAALMMMVFDDIENQINEEKVAAVPSHTPHTSHAIINLDDMDIEGI